MYPDPYVVQRIAADRREALHRKAGLSRLNREARRALRDARHVPGPPRPMHRQSN